MSRLLAKTTEFIRSEDGPTAVEYAVMLALILGGIIVTMSVFGERVDGLYAAILTAVAT